MQKIISAIKKAKNIAIFSHIGPDPDAIGSALALRRGLLKQGKCVDVFCSDKIPNDFYLFEDAKLYNTGNSDYDLLISLDVSSPERLGTFEERFLSHPNTIKIDHHKTVDDFAKINYVVPCSASAVLVYELCKRLKIKIDSEIATLLYFAICGDTCTFTNNGTDSKALIYAGELLSLGADIVKVNSEFFQKKTLSEVKMKSYLLLNAEISPAGYVVMEAPKKLYEKFGHDPENDNLGNLPNTYLSCGFKIAAILKEKEDGVHVSLRSQPDYDVSVIAEKFGGGGHKNASGYLTEDSILKTREKLCLEIEKYIKEKK